MKVYDMSPPIVSRPCGANPRAADCSVIYRETGINGFIEPILSDIGGTQGACVIEDLFPSVRSDDPPGGRTVGQYMAERVAVLSFAEKMEPLAPYFDDQRQLCIDPCDKQTLSAFFERFDDLEIRPDEIESRLHAMGLNLSDVEGILFHSGQSRYYANGSHEPSEYFYFYGPHLGPEACALLAAARLKLVGVDAPGLYDTAHVWTGEELAPSLNPEFRETLRIRRDVSPVREPYKGLLAAGILVYQNLLIPAELVGKQVSFTGLPLRTDLGPALSHPVRAVAIV